MSAVSLAIARPLGWLLLAFLSFFIGVQLSGLARRVAAILHIVIVYYFLACGPENLDLLPISGLFVPLIHGFTVHATGILLSSEASLQFSSTPFLQRIRPIILLLADLRGLQRGGAPASGPASASGPAPGKEDDAPALGPESAKEDDAPASGPESAKEDGAPALGEEDGALASGPASGKEDGAPASGKEDGETNRLRFAIIKSIRALAFWALNYVLTEYTFRRVHRSVYINLDDVALDKQTLLPNFERRELLIRSSLCFQWIWSTYCLLTAAHDLCAVLIIKPEASISVLIDGDADCVAYLGLRGIESMDDDKPFRSKDKELWRSGGLDVGEVLMKFKDLCE
ncbi:hypothetical protein EG328_001590 [Venturia inaequalis]|uniref:Uncharacterized protein n=1 Tax=Venturia inaequalis TaxID=5025 RepID=A0A8H3Z6E3_VENIN|nr:hypothetical protein EG327_008908 [Venturia inaequalis]KAE9987775.1 hypothetical protein EG328_001590 [Venturia inaequalis]